VNNRKTTIAGRALRCVARRSALFAVIMGASGIGSVEARAQLAVGRIELVMQLAEGAERQAAIGVRNESAQPVQAIVKLEDWDRATDGSNRWYAYGTHTGRGSCAPALSIFPQSLRLEPGAEQAIRVVLDSARAPGGECWAAAVVETYKPAERGGQRIMYVVRTAVKIYVQSPALVTSGEIDSLKVVSDSTGNDASAVELHFSNTGSGHLTAKGTLEIRRPDNTTVRRVAMPVVYALPGARQMVRVPMPDLPAGDYVLLATMDYGGEDIAATLLEYRRK
jgi:P pilus assembly chaperone PapD